MGKKHNKSQAKPKYVFRKNENIGASDAIDDRKFLEECFIDTGNLNMLLDTNSPQYILIGRTGSGKTALLERFIRQDRHIKLEPDELALSYISNNQVLRFFVDAGVNMDLFYRLLWRHVLAIELIKKHYDIVNEERRDNFIQKIVDLFSKNKAKQEAIDYLINWGKSFWKETDYRIREVTNTLEQNLQKSVDTTFRGQLPGLSDIKAGISLGDAKKLSEEKKAEIIQHGQAVVDQIQIRTLTEIIKLLEEDILNDRKKKYYITIDRLDENWINDNLRYHLIRALLETAKDFNNRISNVKVIIAVREDLLDRVFRYTRDPGYQEEKYKSMYLRLTWIHEELENLLDLRVNKLIKEQYTSEEVGIRNILPKTINKEDSVKYILERTMMRPRDVISFLNECIKAAEGKPQITQENVFTAEAVYSENRLRALADEWSSDYNNLIEIILKVLKKLPKNFKLTIFSEEKLDEIILECLTDMNGRPDSILDIARLAYDTSNTTLMITKYMEIFYRVGVIGIKFETYQKVHWSYETPQLGSEIGNETVFYIHPAFWRILGIKP